MSCGGGASANSSSEDTKANNTADKPAKNDNIKKMNEAMAAQNRNPSRKVIGSDLAKTTTDEEQSSSDMRKRYEDNMSSPITDEQIEVGNKICDCLNKQKLFSKMKKAKTKQDVFTIAGYDNDEEVKPMQDCYNKNMIPILKKLGKGASVFAMKSRNYVNDKCLDGTNSFWISIGGYIGRNADKEAVRIDGALNK
jgi:5'-3' exonuclease